MSKLPNLAALHYQLDLEYYHDCIVWLKQRLALAVTGLRKSRGEGHREGFGGLYISDEEVNDIVMSFVVEGESEGESEGENEVQWSTDSLNQQWQYIEQRKAATGGMKIDWLAQVYGLDAAEQFVLLLAFLAEIEPRLAKVYAYLQDDVQQQCVCAVLCQQLYPGDLAMTDWYKVLLYHEPLRKVPLVKLADKKPQSKLTQGVYCEDGIRNFLLGYHYPDENLAQQLTIIMPKNALNEGKCDEHLSPFERLLDELPISQWPVTGLTAADHPALIQTLADSLQTPVYLLRGNQHTSELDFQRWLRDGWLHQVIPVCEWSEKSDTPHWFDVQQYGFILLTDGKPAKCVQWQIDYPAPTTERQYQLWEQSLPEAYLALAQIVEALILITEQFAFTASTISRIALALDHQLQWQQQTPQIDQLMLLCRQQASAPMAELATLVSTDFAWSDLVVSANIQQQLTEFKRNARYSLRYIDESGMDKILGAAASTCAMFCGLSGTGKTMAASVVANELGLDLYRIDLSRVVSKYIGETEKNLDRIFRAAADSRGILFFDEGDALFGKRSEIKDAHDRYANIEVSYLLQKIEQHPGITIIASNFADNIDEAFSRRFDHIIAFVMPGEAERKGIWQRLNLLSLTIDPDIDFDFLSKQFELTGGHIKNCIIGAAFAAKEQQQALAMKHLMVALAREYRKLKRPINRTLFGEYYSLINS